MDALVIHANLQTQTAGASYTTNLLKTNRKRDSEQGKSTEGDGDARSSASETERLTHQLPVPFQALGAPEAQPRMGFSSIFSINLIFLQFEWLSDLGKEIIPYYNPL